VRLETMRKRNAAQDERGRILRWTLRGRTYVPVPASARHSQVSLDEERANPMTDEGGPTLSDQPPDRNIAERKERLG
jgi:hypothetical protein